ncbi:MAG: DUF4369 domain-containing protein [Saprospiraceae bacterium]|nr:DUF4369 domain-containing protein [Saprospiraceae bacterium]
MHQLSRIVFFIFILINCNSIDHEQMDGFLLSGKTNGMSDGTDIYLFDELTEQVIDSTEVWDNEFELKGKLKNPPSAVILRTADELAYLWMENSRMTFDASQSDLRDGNLKGSKIHEWAE